MGEDERLPSLDGHTFRSRPTGNGGDVGPSTVFSYRESDGMIWASYEGGAVRRGFLVGTRDHNQLTFRYVHLGSDGNTSSGRCTSQIGVTNDGRLVLDEQWHGESRPRSGTSRLEQDQA